eukprot:gene30586-37827_t
MSRTGGKPLTATRKTPQLTGHLERPASRAEINSLEFELEERVRMNLRNTYLSNKDEVNSNLSLIHKLKSDLDNKEYELNTKFDLEVIRINKEFHNEKARDLDKLTATEFKMDQMSDTLKYLNGLFKTMQDDTSTLKTGDLASKCFRLERENADLTEQNATFDVIKMTLTNTEKKLKAAELHTKTCEDELHRLKKELLRRDEAINQLMEKEALRNAEIEKLNRISKSKDDELINMDLKDPATSVLCVKCRKGLDDLSNIRAAILGDGSNKNSKLTCEEYRILLPNLKGRRPHRNVPWLKSCMRSILLAKLREDVCLYQIRGDVTQFASYVYSWFHRDTTGLSGTLLTKLLQQCDEDRWGLYYGVKVLSKEKADPEATIFYSLLDNEFGTDGLQFIMYCLSVILSIGGVKLWRQFGAAFTHGGSINRKPADDSHTVNTVWLDIELAKEAVKMILVRALASHVSDALDAVDALKVKPSEEEMKVLVEVESTPRLEVVEGDNGSVAGSAAGSAISGKPGSGSNASVGGKSTVSANSKVEVKVEVVEPPKPAEDQFPDENSADKKSSYMEEATHIDLFMWLRLMLQQMHADQIHRNAAIRLMFETASIGALTPQTANYDASGNAVTPVATGAAAFGASNAHVEYPQFQSICVTLFPYLPMNEISMLYRECYEIGNKRVNAEIFTKQANLRGYFTYALKLPLLPLLKPYLGEPTTPPVEVHDLSVGINYDTYAKNDKALTAAVHEESGYTAKTEITLRSKLATIIHRKLAAIMPSLKHFIHALPDKFKSMLNDAINVVNLALHDTYAKLRHLEHEANHNASSANLVAQKTAALSALTGSKIPSPQDKKYVDGLQPYIAYRRLMALATFIKSVTDNPIRPEELFSADMLDNNVNQIDKAINKAEQILTSLETNIVLSTAGRVNSKNVDKYSSFEAVRKVLVTRRLQNVIRKFVNKDVAIPRSIRTLMSAGYLRQTHGNYTGKFLLKNRDVYHDPWYGQIAVAEIYKFKYIYDYKAISMGLECITLPQAVTSYHYFVYGCMDVADRAIHDLFTCIRAYRFGVPRLRMFAAFLGDGRELDEATAEMLRTPHAYNVYMTL